MKPLSIISIILISVISLGTLIYALVNNNETASNTNYEISDDVERNDDLENDEFIQGNGENNDAFVDDGGSMIEVAEVFPMIMSEGAVQNAIHHMSHQKVFAKEKWGHIQITDERINRLLEVIDYNSYSHEELYRQILERWAIGDFSQAVEDHNSIWRLQNGTIGKATRLLTEEEEKEYIMKHFN
ncbi:DUF6241 domain-containing protein [Evansella sp. AB-P1]|uniref:DUF6241 domain-containing protein n=1 Tax=Evansella sp. AB-P1 TaxID=3037653 RepID=UPI00241EB982|nr:DUF6241 domain-containing protein [Evansella sp. AB-P1]MDG5789853.1 DUF6241 domain-containing protein [Evansella sp. AB-P1]